jgi:hypothetical protein
MLFTLLVSHFYYVIDGAEAYLKANGKRGTAVKKLPGEQINEGV